MDPFPQSQLYGVKYNNEQAQEWLKGVGIAYAWDAVMLQPVWGFIRAVMISALTYTGCFDTWLGRKWSDVQYVISNFLG